MAEPSRALVLVVDDEEGIRRSVAAFLADEGYEAVTAPDAERALAALDDHEPHLVLLDVVLPGTDGIALLERLRRDREEIPVIMMSGQATVDLAVRATKLGAYDFLEKPLDPPKLLITVARALEHAALSRENRELRRGAAGESMLGTSRVMNELREAIARAAPSSGRVLIMGENGTGKELVARALHEQSARRAGPFVKMNCAAIPRDLVESELFGHERGAFTGALRLHRGRFEVAHQGTLFLDEVGDMSLELQAKLLRVLEEGEVERVGGTAPIKVAVRVISATNKDITAEIAAGRFRDDLYYRLSVIPLRVPPLRERTEDIALLAGHFIEHFARENNRRAREIGSGALAALMAHRWPGNVRELKNLMERLVIMGSGAPVGAEEVAALLGASHGGAGAGPAGTAASAGAEWDSQGGEAVLRRRVEEYEASVIRSALDATGWNVSEAAKRLQTDRANLHRKMKRLAIARQRNSLG